MAFRFGQLRDLIREAVENLYQTLGVSPTATADEIKAAFRKLALQHHPDRGGSLEMMKKINVAYSTLSDPEKRRKYDGAPRTSTSSAARDPWEDFARSAWQAAQEQERRRREREAQQRRQPPPPPPRNEPPPPTGTQYRFFHFNDGNKSRKFWNASVPLPKNGPYGTFHIIVQWGKIGTSGQMLVHDFPTRQEAQEFRDKLIRSKLRKGYVESRSSMGAGQPPSWDEVQRRSQAKEPAASSKPKAQAPNRQPTQPKNKSYKIYGRKAGKPIHTRIGGVVYAPTKTSRFKQGDTASVAVGSDGRATIHNPSTGHTQTWDRAQEGLRRIVDRLVFEAIIIEAFKTPSESQLDECDVNERGDQT